MQFPETKIIEQVEVPVLPLVTMEVPEHTVPMALPLLLEVAEPTTEALEAINPEVRHRAEVTTVPLPDLVPEAIAVVVLPEAADLVAVIVAPEAAPEVPV